MAAATQLAVEALDRDPQAPQAPTRLALEARLGEGATSEVWRARDAHGRAVHLKLGHDRAALPSLIAEVKARLLGASEGLPQPIALGWFDIAQGEARPDGGRPGLVLEAREGAPLETFAGADRAEHLARDVGAALASLHEGGIAHGDVKPANILADERGLFLIDLGLATSAASRAIVGATPRYLALGDGDLGDARARDVLALGLLIAEALQPTLSTRDPLLAAAREAELPAPFHEIVRALLSPAPDARPSARWVVERVRRAPPQVDGRARVRNGYARLRRSLLEEPHTAPVAGAPWLAPLAAWGRSLADISGRPSRLVDAALLGTDEVARWLGALVGSAALAWPIARLAGHGEEALARALVALAASRPAHAITLAALEATLADGPSEAAPEESFGADPVAAAAALASELARLPASESAIRLVERDASVPETSTRAAAKALRLRGELGRAGALATRLERSSDGRSIAVAADLFRRTGDRARAARLLDAQALADAPARAVRARIHLDEGRLDEAIELASPPELWAASEVLALAFARRGDLSDALAVLSSAEALSLDAEERARLHGTRGFVIAASNAGEARTAFALAASHAASASALLEEATYLTGLAGAASDLGHLEEALQASERARRLWEHLGRHAQAARAELNGASALSVAGRTAEAETLAERARRDAVEAGDDRAAGYAALVLADLAPIDSEKGREQASFARRVLESFPADRLRVGARLVKHALIEPAEVLELDTLAKSSEETVTARLEWLTARLEHAADQAPEQRESLVVGVLSLLDAPAAIGVRGAALASATAAARSLGLGDTSLRLAASLRREADALLARAGGFAASARELAWVRAVGAAPIEAASGEQAERLEQLVRSLGSGARLKELLRSVLDALVTWTGVERGLLLLRSPDGRLVPKVGRNLGERDLRGEQLRLSTSISERALYELTPVVAVDAATELSDLHASVHALRLRSVLAVPLVSDGRALGVVYLDDRVRRGAFGARELGWVRTLSTLAATMVARALDEAKLRRVARRAERKGRELERALDDREARLAIAETRSSSNSPIDRAFANIVGESDVLQRALRMAARVAASAVPVLIVGESGSGKELFARAIHASSPRRDKAFLSENVSAIPDTLLESTLFGHVRGAFTGADRTRLGLFDAADAGTLFLDEIGEMRLPMQTKLLRVLEDGVLRPLGTERTRTVDVRLIAATNRDLDRMVAEHTFREDLFYRLGVVTIRIPPLRERPTDIPLLVAHFIEKHALDRDGVARSVRITRGAMKRLETHTWPGNVRQLENEVRRALVLGDGVIEADHLSIGASTAAERPPETGLDLKKRIDSLEASLVREALERTQGNQTQAAKLLGLSRFGLQKMIKRLGITA